MTLSGDDAIVLSAVALKECNGFLKTELQKISAILGVQKIAPPATESPRCTFICIQQFFLRTQSYIFILTINIEKVLQQVSMEGAIYASANLSIDSNKNVLVQYTQRAKAEYEPALTILKNVVETKTRKVIRRVIIDFIVREQTIPLFSEHLAEQVKKECSLLLRTNIPSVSSVAKRMAMNRTLEWGIASSVQHRSYDQASYSLNLFFSSLAPRSSPRAQPEDEQRAVDILLAGKDDPLEPFHLSLRMSTRKTMLRTEWNVDLSCKVGISRVSRSFIHKFWKSQYVPEQEVISDVRAVVFDTIHQPVNE